jgi:hypothetical protein
MMKATFRSCYTQLALIAGLLVGFAAWPILAAEPSTLSENYDKLVSEYMAGKWDDLQIDLKASSTQPSTFTTAQKADIDYIRQTLLECHPLWWVRCKAGKRTQVKASIFGISVTGLYDPLQKEGMRVRFSQDSTDVTLGWAASDMDNPAQAEHGFTKGELNAASIWSSLGMTAGYSQVPFQSLINLSDADKAKLTCELDFRGGLAAAYDGNPRTRRWWFFLAMHYYRPPYQKSPFLMSRKALGAMFAEEVVAHRAKYPSIELPDSVDAEDAEAKVTAAVHDWIERHDWTLAEDKSIRDATKAFALANQSVMRTGGPVQLPSGLQISLDPQKDGELRLKRDQWVVQTLAKK